MDVPGQSCSLWRPKEAMGGVDRKRIGQSQLIAGGDHRRPWEVEMRDRYTKDDGRDERWLCWNRVVTCGDQRRSWEVEIGHE